MLKEQEEDGVVWTPSKFIHRLGREIDNEDSVYYWCYKVCAVVWVGCCRGVWLLLFLLLLVMLQVLLCDVASEQHPSVLPSHHRRFYWRHGVLSLLQGALMMRSSAVQLVQSDVR